MVATEPAVRAVEFESRKVYQSSYHPGYTSWVSFFPGERWQPGFDSFNSKPLEERMKEGGETLRARSGADGQAHFRLTERLDMVENIHLSYQLVVRFNADRSDPDYKPVQSHQYNFYALHYHDQPLA